jgi:hypothetical protein
MTLFADLSKDEATTIAVVGVAAFAVFLAALFVVVRRVVGRKLLESSRRKK